MSEEDLQKKQIIVNFLQQAIVEYDKVINIIKQSKGQKQKFLLISEEMCSKKKGSEYLKSLMLVLTEKMTELQLKKQNIILIVDLVLYKIPWFNNSIHHLHVTNLYSKFLLSLISLDTNYIQIVYKSLISKFIPLDMVEINNNNSKHSMQIQIGGITFSNQALLLTHTKKILNSYEVDELNLYKDLNNDHEQFMLQIFVNHPKYLEKSKDFKKIVVGQSIFNGRMNKVFYIMKQNGQMEDISFVKSINNLIDKNFLKINLVYFATDIYREENSALIDIICKIDKIYPLYSKTLIQLIKESYPHKIKSQFYHKIYIMTLIKIGLQRQKLLPSFLQMIVDSFIAIDTEIKLNNHLDDIDHNDEIDSEKKEQLNDEMAKKLDWLMMIFMEFLKTIFEEQNFNTNQKNELDIFLITKGQIQKEQKDIIFNELLEIFKNKILVTHQSKFVQFYIFYLTSLNEQYLEQFLEMLIKNIVYKDRLLYTTTKINSIYFLGSFLARANFCSDQIIWDKLQIIIDYMIEYTKSNQEFRLINFEKDQQVKQHYIFYHQVQTFIYIICFHLDCFLHLKEEIMEKLYYILEQGFDASIFLNERIFMELQKICKLYDVDPKLIKFLEQQQYKNSINKFRIEQHYPFDPYLLEYSEQYFKHNYRQWNQKHHNLNNEKQFDDSKKQLQISRFSTASSDLFSEYALTPYSNTEPETIYTTQNRKRKFKINIDDEKYTISKKIKIQI